jgi:hypothetical protein
VGEGLNGLAERYPIEPFSFVVNESRLVNTVTGGEAWLVGNAVLRRRVIADNVYEVSVRPPWRRRVESSGLQDRKRPNRVDRTARRLPSRTGVERSEPALSGPA